MNLNVSLAIFGGILGLIVTGTALYTAWMIHQLWKQQAASPHAISPTHIAAAYLSRWTVLDYGVLGVSVIGLLLLAADLTAVMRDKAAFPPYHVIYLMCGLILALMGILLLFVRLFVVIGMAKQPSEPPLYPLFPKHHGQPNDADHSK
jgi:hypothetical protein